MSGGERPGYLAARYNKLVSLYLCSLTSVDNPARFLWTLQASSQVTPHFTRFPSAGGGTANFDLTFVSIRADLDGPSRILIVETKAGVDRAFVNDGFKEFLRKVAGIAEGLANHVGTEYLYAFVAPVFPQISVDPDTFRTVAGIEQVYSEVVGLTLSPAQVDAIRGRVFVLAFSSEDWPIHGVKDSYAAE